MRSRIKLAIILSVLLIGWALLFRFNVTPTGEAKLSVVNPSLQDDASYQEFLNIYAAASSTELVSDKNLSNTDLIGRQLVSDYLTLSSSGQASSDALNSLADKYVESIPTLLAPEKANPADIRNVPNNKANFEAYGAEVTRIYQEYASSLLTIQAKGGVTAFLKNNSGDTPRKMADVYGRTAKKLKEISVPNALIESHLDLINVYLGNEAAMASLSEIDSDPASAFAGLLLINSNIDFEAEKLMKIQQVLTANGI